MFGDGLRLSDEPLEGFLAALLLQLLPIHVPAGQVVAVEPVALQEGREDGRDSHHHTCTKACPPEQWGPTCGAHRVRVKRSTGPSLPAQRQRLPCVLPPGNRWGEPQG